jgi:hypothetical protein
LGSAETRARNEERNGKNVTILKRRSIIQSAILNYTGKTR